MPDPQTLAQKWRAKYGRDYDDLTDAQLEAKIDAKYPGAYDDLPRSQSGLKDPKSGVTYQEGATEPIPAKSLTKVALVTKIGKEAAANQAESDRLASEHPVLTTAAMLATAAGPGMLRAASMRAVPIAARAVAVGKAAAKGALPIVKYEVVKNALETVGVPSAAAAAAAAIVSARGGKEPVKATEPPAAATPRPVAMPATEPVVAPAAAPVAPAPTKPAVSQQALRSANGLAVRRAAKSANATFTPEQFEEASALVDDGMAPAQAVLKVKRAAEITTGEAAAAELAKRPGFMTDAQREAEIRARVGNRSPKR